MSDKPYLGQIVTNKINCKTMKKLILKNDGGRYCPPIVERIDVAVEQGFATSGEGGFELPGFGDPKDGGDF